MAKQATSGGAARTRTRTAAARPKTSSKAAPKSAPKVSSKAATKAVKPTQPSKVKKAARPAAATSRGVAAKPRGKPAKLQVAGKAIRSGHSSSAPKGSARGQSAVRSKPRAAPAATSTAPASKPRGSAPAAQKKPKLAKRVTFDRKTLAGIKKSLEDQRKDLLDQLTEIEEAAFSPSQTEASSEAGFDDDYADAGTATFEREKDLSIANNINSLVDKIDKALEKIEEGTYGICENCGQPISADRLKALPHVLLCINCKKAEERR